jgi:hypothetical protein
MKIEPIRIATATAETSVPAKPQALQAIVELVRRDAVVDSRQYLDETTVPHGGE